MGTNEDLLKKIQDGELVYPAIAKHSEDEDYDEFIQRSLKNEIGSKVKIADLRENLDVTRICELTEKDIERINKYKRALNTLTEC